MPATVATGVGDLREWHVSVNDVPIATDDSASTAEDTPVNVDVLGNDTDVESDPLVVDSVTQGSNGTVTNNGTDVTYTPNGNWNGIDTFTYTVTDGNGGFDTASVTVTVDTTPPVVTVLMVVMSGRWSCRPSAVWPAG